MTEFGLLSIIALLGAIVIGAVASYTGLVVLRRGQSLSRFLGLLPLIAGFVLLGGAACLLIGGLIAGNVILWN